MADFEHSLTLWADPDVVRYITGRPNTREEVWQRYLRRAGHWHLNGYGYWLVEDIATGSFLGEVGFADYKREITPPIGPFPEAGWVLAPQAHGRGIATEAMRAAIDWMDRTHGPEKICCILDPAHSASANVARKLGFGDEARAHYNAQDISVYWRHRADTAEMGS